MCEHGEDGEEGEDEHGEHTARIGFHVLLLYEVLRQVAAANRYDGDDEVEHEDECLSHGVGRLVAQLREVGRCPKEEEPPYAVGEQLADDEGPGLTIGEALQERNLQVVVGLFAYRSSSGSGFLGCGVVVLLNVG